MHSTQPFRGVHLLAYTDDTYPVVLPTRSRRSFITEQLLRTSRDQYVKAQSATIDPAPSWSNRGVSETDSDACRSVEAAGEARPFEAA